MTITSLLKITANKDDLNELSLFLSEAADSYKNRGRNRLADNAKKLADDIYGTLKAAGYYD